MAGHFSRKKLLVFCKKMAAKGDFLWPALPTWCPGCGNFTSWQVLAQVLAELGLDPAAVAISYDIGCSGNMGNFLRTSAFLGLHGRAIPLAVGIKQARSDLTVLAIGGDGGFLAEGTNHLIHAARRNDDITVILINNHLFSLTTGQAAPTTPADLPNKTADLFQKAQPLNPLALALAAGAGFVARVFVGQPDYREVLAAAITHHGFSLLEVLSPCVTFDNVYTFDWYRRHIIAIKPAVNRQKALELAISGDRKIPVGIFFNK